MIAPCVEKDDMIQFGAQVVLSHPIADGFEPIEHAQMTYEVTVNKVLTE